MGKTFDEIPDYVIPWIEEQKLFWVATAPSSVEGHVNVSPRSGKFKVISPTKVWFEDLSGSGIETIAHLRDTNGRITILFTAFSGPPRICRLYGKGVAYEYGTPEYDQLITSENRNPGSRAAIVIDVHRVGTSCGYSIPFFEYKEDRNTLNDFYTKFEKADADGDYANGIRARWGTNNICSIDGLPGLTKAQHATRPAGDHIYKKTVQKSGSKQSAVKDNKIQMLLAFVGGVICAALLLGRPAIVA